MAELLRVPIPRNTLTSIRAERVSGDELDSVPNGDSHYTESVPCEDVGFSTVVTGFDSTYTYQQETLLDDDMENIVLGLKIPRSCTLALDQKVINMETFKNIILNEKIPVSTSLAIAVGLPMSGKSFVIDNFLQENIVLKEESKNTHSHYLNRKRKKNGLTVHELCILGKNRRYAWSFSTKRHGALFALLTCLIRQTRYNLLSVQDLDLKSDKPALPSNQSLLAEHFYLLMEKCKKHLKGIATDHVKLSLLHDGISLGNVFDVGVNKGIYELLPIIFACCRNHVRYVFYSLEHDGGKNLFAKPDLSDDRYKSRYDDRMVMKLRPRLSYILNFASMCYFASSKCKTVMVATSNGKECQDNFLKTKVIIEGQAKSQMVDHCLNKWSCVDFSNTKHSLNELKEMAEQFVANESLYQSEMPLKWIVLRSFLASLKTKDDRPIFIMTKSAIEENAKLLNMDGDEFDNFLTAFTNFGSILYLDKFKELNHLVITDIWAFANCLNELYYPRSVDYPYLLKFGFVTQAEVKMILGGNEEDFMLILATLAMIAKIASGKSIIVDGRHGPDQVCYYVPGARVGDKYISTENDFAFLEIRSVNFPANMQACIAHCITENSDVTLVMCQECNLTKFQFNYPECLIMIEMIYEGEKTKLRIVNGFDELQSSACIENACLKVIKGICGCLTKKTNLIRDLTFNIGVPCCLPDEVHYLYCDNDTISTCKECSIMNSFRHCWRNAAMKCKELSENDEIRLKPANSLTLDDIAQTANDIAKSKPTEENLKELLHALKLEETEIKNLLKDDDLSFSVMSILMKWKKKFNNKTLLAKTLRELNYNAIALRLDPLSTA